MDAVEDHAAEIAEPGGEQALRESVLRYSREIAFAAAEVYAHAAEARGAWDARLEGLVVDAVLRGEADDSMQSRATALGWGSTTRVAVTPAGGSEGVVDGLRRSAAKLGVDSLAAVQGRRLVCILGNVDDPMEAARELEAHFGEGAIVVGPTVPHLFAAGRSARAALAGQSCAHAWPEAPRPVSADDLLAERVLVGDQPARVHLVERIFRPLSESGAGTSCRRLRSTSRAAADSRAPRASSSCTPTRSATGSARSPTSPGTTSPTHDAHTVRIALALGRLATPPHRAPRSPLSLSSNM